MAIKKNTKQADDIKINLPVKFKLIDTKDDGQKGIIEAYVSIFDNVDLVGDVIVKGAFAESLAKKLPKGVWAHNWDEPIAKTLEAREDDKGLYIKGKFIEGVQRADEAYKLIKEGVIDEFSIGFRVLDDEWREDGVRVIKKVKVYEWSPVLAGANPDTEVISIKSEKQETKGIIEDELAVDYNDRSKKWVMLDAMDTILYKFFDVYFRATTKSSDFKTLITEVNGLMIKLADRYAELTGGDNEKTVKDDKIALFEKIANQLDNKNKVDRIKVDDKNGVVKVFYTENNESKSYELKMSDNFIKYKKEQKAQKVDTNKEVSNATQKILRVRQITKQNIKAGQYLLKITKI